jgi:hypothetical protein
MKHLDNQAAILGLNSPNKRSSQEINAHPRDGIPRRDNQCDPRIRIDVHGTLEMAKLQSGNGSSKI